MKLRLVNIVIQNQFKIKIINWITGIKLSLYQI